MAGFSTYLQDHILSWIKGTNMPAAPAAVYVGLFSVAPTDSGGGTEVTTTIRVAGRVAATFGAVASGSPSSIANTIQVDFGDAAGAVPSVVAFAIFDAAAAGNMIGWALLSPAVAVAATQPVKFDVGDLEVTLD